MNVNMSGNMSGKSSDLAYYMRRGVPKESGERKEFDKLLEMYKTTKNLSERDRIKKELENSPTYKAEFKEFKDYIKKKRRSRRTEFRRNENTRNTQ
ncbi:MAG: ERAP1-like C-terminal domain-containing protein [Oscillospiraceae bacterium]|nr:ERAP1-like C-terminal domain-containing protein [Oscillospiraceae bacterium]